MLLVASIPIAIEIVSTATLALGSRQLSEHGAIVTRLTSIEEMAGMNMLCSDKTGTLTLNKMVIQVRTYRRHALASPPPLSHPTPPPPPPKNRIPHSDTRVRIRGVEAIPDDSFSRRRSIRPCLCEA